MEMRKLGGAVGAKDRGREESKALRSFDDSLDNLKEIYGHIHLDYIGFDPSHEGIMSGHFFKYPSQLEGDNQSSFDEHGFRIEAILSGPKEYPGLEEILNETGGSVPLFASDFDTTGANISIFDLVNLFAPFMPEKEIDPDTRKPIASRIPERPIWTWGADLGIEAYYDNSKSVNQPTEN